MYYKNAYWILSERQREARKRYENLPEKKKNLKVNMIVKGIKIFLKKEKKKSPNIIVNTIKIFLKIKNKL